MGIVHGKSIEKLEDNNNRNLKNLNARVDRINIDGLAKTKDDYVTSAVTDLFKATNFEEMLQKSYTVRKNLENLGCFQNVMIHVETSSGPKATPEYGYEVTFVVRELKQIAGGVQTMVGTNNEGLIVVSARAPNIFGRGEQMQGEFSYGNKQTKNANFRFTKPLLYKYNASIAGSFFIHDQEWPMSNYGLKEKGAIIDFSFNSLNNLRHSLQWEGVLRELNVSNRYAAFDVREHAGYSQKSSLRHILTYDTRLLDAFHSSRLLTKVTSELAGLGGNVAFIKNDLLLQVDIPIIKDFILQGSLSGGHMLPLDSTRKNMVLCDNFFLGGPITFRGFEMRGVGPSAQGSLIGAKMYWCAGLSLFTPLPFRPNMGGFGEHFQTHFFANVGNLGNFNIADGLPSLIQQARFAYGIGLALRIGKIARIEVNYCFPTWIQEGDRAMHGVQIGLGTTL